MSINDGRCDYTLADAGDTIYVHTHKDISNSCHLFTQNAMACYGGGDTLKAKSDLAVPYTISWYDDYELTHLRKKEVITDADTWSLYDTNNIFNRSYLYVSVARDGNCPTVYGIPTHSVNMGNDTTTIACGQTYRFYDSGGATGDFAANEVTVHTFTTSSDRQIALHFEELNLSSTAKMRVISGSELLADSVICDITSASSNPGLILSKGNTLTLLFMAGPVTDAGWSAIVEPTPGIAIIDVWPENKVTYSYEVCQSQTNDWMTTYGNPYNIAPDVASLAELNTAIRKTRSMPYTFQKTLPDADSHGCDSTVTFILTVNPPSHYDTTIVTTNLHGGNCTWHGTTYTESGRYSFLTTLPDGCDSLDILDFIILEIDTSNNEFCEGDSTILGITVKEPEMTWRDDLIPPTVNIGDVLCTDGTTMNVDTFVKYYPEHGKKPKGVVFYVDSTEMHGLAAALSDATTASVSVSNIKTPSATSDRMTALADMNGYDNTMYIKNNAGSNFKSNSPGVYYCYYYNHETFSTDTIHHGWYLPALGELNLLFANRVEYHYTLRELKKINNKVTLMPSGTWYTGNYMSSTLGNAFGGYNAWAVQCGEYYWQSWYYNGTAQVHPQGWTSWNGSRHIRAITQF